MTTELTSRERVQQAVNHQFQLLAEKDEATVVEDAARSARNDAKSSDVVKVAEEKALVAKDTLIDAVNAEYDKIAGAVARVLERAQSTYGAKESEARSARNDAAHRATEVYDKVVADAQGEYDFALAAAEADVHRARREVEAIQATINQSRQNVKESLGIDLATLVG